MAARCPFAVWKPLPEATSQPVMAEVRGLIYHTPVGTMRGTWDYFARTSVGVESTFLMGCPLCGEDLDGVVWQIMDVDRRADANVQGNRFFGSIEMCDHGDPSRPLSPRQLAAAVELGLWYRERFGTPGRLCPSPLMAGFGWHAMWLDTPYMFDDRTTPWSSAPGKVCPGPVRIRQLKTVVFPAVFAGTSLEGDGMATIDQVYARQEGYHRLLVEGDDTHPHNLKQVRADIAAVKALVATQSGGDDGPTPVVVRLADDQLATLKDQVLAELRAAVAELALPQATAQAVAGEFAGRLQQ